MEDEMMSRFTPLNYSIDNSQNGDKILKKFAHRRKLDINIKQEEDNILNGNCTDLKDICSGGKYEFSKPKKNKSKKKKKDQSKYDGLELNLSSLSSDNAGCKDHGNDLGSKIKKKKPTLELSIDETNDNNDKDLGSISKALSKKKRLINREHLKLDKFHKHKRISSQSYLESNLNHEELLFNSGKRNNEKKKSKIVVKSHEKMLVSKGIPRDEPCSEIKISDEEISGHSIKKKKSKKKRRTSSITLEHSDLRVELGDNNSAEVSPKNKSSRAGKIADEEGNGNFIKKEKKSSRSLENSGLNFELDDDKLQSSVKKNKKKKKKGSTNCLTKSELDESREEVDENISFIKSNISHEDEGHDRNLFEETSIERKKKKKKKKKHSFDAHDISDSLIPSNAFNVEEENVKRNLNLESCVSDKDLFNEPLMKKKKKKKKHSSDADEFSDSMIQSSLVCSPVGKSIQSNLESNASDEDRFEEPLMKKKKNHSSDADEFSDSMIQSSLVCSPVGKSIQSNLESNISDEDRFEEPFMKKKKHFSDAGKISYPITQADICHSGEDNVVRESGLDSNGFDEDAFEETLKKRKRKKKSFFEAHSSIVNNSNPADYKDEEDNEKESSLTENQMDKTIKFSQKEEKKQEFNESKENDGPKFAENESIERNGECLDPSSKTSNLNKGSRKEEMSLNMYFQQAANKESENESKSGSSEDKTVKSAKIPTKSEKKTQKSESRKESNSNNNDLIEPTDLHSWTLTVDDKKDFKKKGFHIEFGNWSKKECDILKNNVETFCEIARVEVSAIRKMIFDDSCFAKRTRSDIGFYNKLAEGINRPLKEIYRKLRQIYDPENYKGEFSKAENKTLFTLQKKYGNNWIKIGEEMGRSAGAVSKKFKRVNFKPGDSESGEVKNMIKNGRWSKEETENLKKAIKQLFQNDETEEVDERKIHWDAVAKIVETRNSEQCRRKWLLQLSWKKPNEKLKKWGQADNVRFILELSNCGAANEKLVKWEEISEGIQRSASAQFMKTKWYGLKTLVPNYHSLEFNELLDWLTKNYVQDLTDRFPALTI